MGATTLALTMGGLAAVQSLAQTGRQNSQAAYQQEQMKANAQAARNQALIAAEQGRLEGENLDRQRSALRREYADLQAGNAASLGALGVDMSSGSAAATLEGNAAHFAADVAANRYQKAVSQWETDENVKARLTEARNYDKAASWYGSTVKNLGQSLLTAGISGLASGIGAYAMSGGFGSAKSGSDSLLNSGQNLFESAVRPALTASSRTGSWTRFRKLTS